MQRFESKDLSIFQQWTFKVGQKTFRGCRETSPMFSPSINCVLFSLRFAVLDREAILIGSDTPIAISGSETKEH